MYSQTIINELFLSFPFPQKTANAFVIINQPIHLYIYRKQNKANSTSNLFGKAIT